MAKKCSCRLPKRSSLRRVANHNNVVKTEAATINSRPSNSNKASTNSKRDIVKTKDDLRRRLTTIEITKSMVEANLS